MQMEEHNKTNLFNSTLFTNESVSSSRIIYTPSPFARSSLLFLQETGTLQAKRPHVSSRQNLQSYLFFVVLDGEGWLEYPASPGHNGQHYELSKGSAVFIDCRKGYSQSSSESLWHLSWIHFNAASMPAIYNKYCERGGKCVFHLDDPAPFVSLLDDLYETANGSSFVRDVEINTLLSEMIGLLFQETVYEENEKPVGMNTGANTCGSNGERIDVSAIKSYIDTHYQEPLSLESLGERFYFSKHYIARAFKETFGMSVGSYITIVRVGRAKELLRFSDMSILEVGIASGYEDTNYFSRCFKKVEGCSPSEFRRNWMSGKE